VITTLFDRREEPGLVWVCAFAAPACDPVCDQLVESGELQLKVPEILTSSDISRSSHNPMISKHMINKLTIGKFARIAAVAFGLSLFALAQSPAPASSTPAAAPDAPSATASNPAADITLKATGTKVGTINIEQAIFSSNEGQREFQALSKKFEPKQSELKSAADEIDSLKKQLSTQEGKLNDEARDKLVKQIESKQKSFERAQQDAQEDFQGQQGEIGNRILTKMAPLIVKYAADNGYGMIIDTSQQWPRGPVIWYGPAVDITQPVVEGYNTQSGVAPPAPGTAPAKPATSTKPKPATPPAKQ
jgi:outer membrane protein